MRSTTHRIAFYGFMLTLVLGAAMGCAYCLPAGVGLAMAATAWELWQGTRLDHTRALGPLMTATAMAAALIDPTGLALSATGGVLGVVWANTMLFGGPRVVYNV